MITLNHYLMISGLLFATGLVGVVVRRNILTIYMCLEMMLSAANLTLVAFSRLWDERTGQLIVLFVLAVAAAEAAVGLALFIALFRHRRTIDINRINLMRW